MAERHRGRHASLARIDPLPVLGGKQAQIERIDIESCILENLLRNTGQSIGLGILAGAGSVVARRTDDKQHPRPRGCLLPFRVGALQPRTGASPFDRQVVPRVSVSFVYCGSNKGVRPEYAAAAAHLGALLAREKIELV